MKPLVTDIEARTGSNSDFRRVIHTGAHLQLVLMSLEPGEELGEEVHEGTDQFFRVELGEGEVVIDGATSRIGEDSAIVVPAGARHNVRNTGRGSLRFYTIYAPPEHPDGTVHRTRAEAAAAERSAGH